jgi:hypothetical protein
MAGLKPDATDNGRTQVGRYRQWPGLKPDATDDGRRELNGI